MPDTLSSPHPRSTKAGPAAARGQSRQTWGQTQAVVIDGDRDVFANIDNFFDSLADDDYAPPPARVPLTAAAALAPGAALAPAASQAAAGGG